MIFAKYGRIKNSFTKPTHCPKCGRTYKATVRGRCVYCGEMLKKYNW